MKIATPKKLDVDFYTYTTTGSIRGNWFRLETVFAFVFFGVNPRAHYSRPVATFGCN
jgi:hypothetical protein